MKEFITGHPFTTEIRLLPSNQDSILILACDGLWDVCTDQEACDYIQNDIDNPQRCAELLVDFALEQGSTDNLSVIVVRLAERRTPTDSTETDELKLNTEEVNSVSSPSHHEEDSDSDCGQVDKITHHDPHSNINTT